MLLSGSGSAGSVRLIKTQQQQSGWRKERFPEGSISALTRSFSYLSGNLAIPELAGGGSLGGEERESCFIIESTSLHAHQVCRAFHFRPPFSTSLLPFFTRSLCLNKNLRLASKVEDYSAIKQANE